MAAPVKERRPEAAPVRPVRLGPRDVHGGTPAGRHHPPQIAPCARALPGEADRAAGILGRDRPERVFLAQRDAAGGWRKLTYARDPGARSAASARRCCNASSRPSGRSRSCPATTSSMRCSASPPCMSASPTRRSRRPIRSSRTISASCARSSSCSRRVSSSPPTASPTARAIEAVVPPDVEVVVGRNPLPGRPTTPFADAAGAGRDSGADAAHAQVGPTPSPSSCSPRARPARRRR